MTKEELDAMQAAWKDYPSQDNEGYQPERGSFKAGFFAALNWVKETQAPTKVSKYMGEAEALDKKVGELEECLKKKDEMLLELNEKVRSLIETLYFGMAKEYLINETIEKDSTLQKVHQVLALNPSNYQASAAAKDRVIAEIRTCIGAFDNDFGESIIGEALPKLKSALAELDAIEGGGK